MSSTCGPSKLDFFHNECPNRMEGPLELRRLLDGVPSLRIQYTHQHRDVVAIGWGLGGRAQGGAGGPWSGAGGSYYFSSSGGICVMIDTAPVLSVRRTRVYA
eukprot:730115-Prorocentrum_minimum.AAC.2